MSTGARDHPKRKRVTESDWSLLIPDVSSLKSVVEAATAVIPRIVFKVKKRDGLYFITVDGHDPGYVCCVSARLQVEGMTFTDGVMAGSGNDLSFCLDCKQVLYSIESPSCAHVSLRLDGYVVDSKVALRWADPEHPAHDEDNRLPVFVDEDVDELEDMEFDFTIHIPLVKLRELLKKAPKARAEHVRMKLLRGNDDGSGSPPSIFELSIEGDTMHRQRFGQLLVREEDNSLSCKPMQDDAGARLLADEDKYELAFEGMYPVEKLNAFVRIVPTKYLEARAKNHMPLLLTHKLGAVDDDSHVHFLVAPVHDEA
jgi:hypothetical protein